MSTETAIHARKVLSASSGEWIPCVWCHMQGESRPGYELYKSVFHEHARNLPCDHPLSQHINFVFCSERHRQFYLHSHRDLGNLPPGYKTSL